VALSEEMTHGIAGGKMVIDTHVGHTCRRIELAASDPRQRGHVFSECCLNGGGIEADGAIGAATT